MQNRVHVSPSSHRFLILFAFFVIISIIMLTLLKDNFETHKERLYNIVYFATKSSSVLDLSRYSVKTHRGYITLQELNENVFQKLGYEIIEPTLPVPKVRMINEPICEEVFSNWLKVSQLPQSEVPLSQIPDELSDEFLLYGYTAIDSWYRNDKTLGDHPRNWDQISEFMKLSKKNLSAKAYLKESESMYNAMSAHRLDGMRGLVVGSMQPWVEVMALQHGAESILTVEYNTLNVQSEFQNRLSSITPAELAKDWNRYSNSFDFAASFSSIEHSGLGRYGDPIDPIGDIREMLKIRCMLKKGAILFLAVPIGIDAIHFNAHRYYGSIRLAMMFYGFEWLETFHLNFEQPVDLNMDRFAEKKLFSLTDSHHTMVLRKI